MSHRDIYNGCMLPERCMQHGQGTLHSSSRMFTAQCTSATGVNYVQHIQPPAAVPWCESTCAGYATTSTNQHVQHIYSCYVSTIRVVMSLLVAMHLTCMTAHSATFRLAHCDLFWNINHFSRPPVMSAGSIENRCVPPSQGARPMSTMKW